MQCNARQNGQEWRLSRVTCAPPFIRSFAHSLPPPLSLRSPMETERDSLAAFHAFLFRPKTHLPPPPPHSLFLSGAVCQRNHMDGQLSISTPFIWTLTRMEIPRWATGFHSICGTSLPPSLARSLAMPAVSIAKGQMGEKPRTYGFSFFLSSRLLTPLPERVREPRKKPFTVGQCGSAAVAVIMAWDGIGLSSACRRAFTLGSLARSGSNSNFQWMDRCQSVSQSASE